MSGGIAYVYDPAARSGDHCNTAMVRLERVPPAAPGPATAPTSRIVAAASGLGREQPAGDNCLRFDAERSAHPDSNRLTRHTNSARAAEILSNWTKRWALLEVSRPIPPRAPGAPPLARGTSLPSPRIAS